MVVDVWHGISTVIREHKVEIDASHDKHTADYM
jgi:hypothetical protein